MTTTRTITSGSIVFGLTSSVLIPNGGIISLVLLAIVVVFIFGFLYFQEVKVRIKARQEKLLTATTEAVMA